MYPGPLHPIAVGIGNAAPAPSMRIVTLLVGTDMVLIRGKELLPRTFIKHGSPAARIGKYGEVGVALAPFFPREVRTEVQGYGLN